MREFVAGLILGGFLTLMLGLGATTHEVSPEVPKAAPPIVYVKAPQIVFAKEDPKDPSPPTPPDPVFDPAPSPPPPPVEEPPENDPELPPGSGGARDRYYGPFTTAWHPGWPYPPWSVNWDGVAFCESTNRWHINTGNGFYGGLQFTLSTWHWYGGKRFAYWPHHATRYEQKVIAERVLTGWSGQNNIPPMSYRPAQGPGAWPVCRRYM